MSDDKRLLDSDAMYRELLRVGGEWADTKAAFQALDGTTASVLADLTMGYSPTSVKGAGGGISRAEAETMARRSQAFRDHLASVAVANKAYLRAQVKYDSLRTLVELRRSEESTRRAEMAL